MKNKAVEMMIMAQFNTTEKVNVEFLYSVSTAETYKIVMWKGDVRTEYELKIELDLISEEDFGQRWGIKQ